MGQLLANAPIVAVNGGAPTAVALALSYCAVLPKRTDLPHFVKDNHAFINPDIAWLLFEFRPPYEGEYGPAGVLLERISLSPDGETVGYYKAYVPGEDNFIASWTVRDGVFTEVRRFA